MKSVQCSLRRVVDRNREVMRGRRVGDGVAHQARTEDGDRPRYRRPVAVLSCRHGT